MPLLDGPPVSATTRTLADDVFERLSVAIITEELAPGEVLRDGELARGLGVSRTPVREALRRLTQLGMVEVVASRYTRVTEVDDQRIIDTLEYSGYQAGIALRMSIARMDDLQLAGAVERIDAVIAANAAGDEGAIFDTAREFVRYTTSLSGNVVFNGVMRETGVMVLRNLRSRRPTRRTQEQRDDGYREMRAALLARDADRAEAAFRRQHEL
ncbi:GntR family transcriptional regulator [Microbacterium flavum]|uniref:GntR family transcriptional regulator n=1 Tax=Microbacterium flavum TaxID=415216 RepID=A0ABS5XTP5_9MICO|nr:GntR family transcriptional regulator [Microbacterium flavum]MBT8797791.1 GntR family transcriptional regulator [Microbacterium flavum]